MRLRQAGDSNLAHVPLNQRRLHRHIRELARRRSYDPRAELREQSPRDFAQSTPEATLDSVKRRRRRRRRSRQKTRQFNYRILTFL